MRHPSLSALLSVALAIALLSTTMSCGDTTQPAPNTLTASAIAANSVTSQSGTTGQSVAERPSVRVTSSSGVAVPSVVVTFAITAGGGTLTGMSPTSDANGIATVGGWTLGPAAGANAMTATVSGLAPVTFTVNATAPVPNLTLTPALAATTPLGSVSFTASAAVTWSVNGVPSGSAATGTISPTGTYTAPATIPSGDSIIVTATLTANTSVQRTSTVFFVPETTTRDYYVALPRVVDAAAPARTRFLLVPSATATTVAFIPNSGPQVPLESIGSGVMTFTVEPSASIAGYITGTLHNFIGRLDYRNLSGGQIKLTNLSLNIRDATMPTVVVTPLAADAQRSPYVLNLRVDTIMAYPRAEMVARALQLLGGDLFDFVAVIATVTTNNNRVHIGLRNDVMGIGRPISNSSASWGGTGKLRGVNAFPIDGLFDGAEQGFMHETGHSWINHATGDPVLAPGPHWPMSTMAYGTMGFNIPGSGVGGNFPFTLTSLGNGTVRVNTATASDLFTPVDLYAMGLLAPELVPPQYVLAPSVDPTSLVNGQILPATQYTINDYIASQGPRVPTSANAPHAFSTAVVVLTYGRLMTATEMAFFDRAAARAETTVALQSMNGLALVTASGFSIATGGRGTMRTILP